MRFSVSITAAAIALGILFGAVACRRNQQVGDHVMVDWRGGEFPAVVVAIEGPAKFRVHYDGFGDDWDETIPGTRIKSRLTPGVMPPPPAAIRPKLAPSASGSASSTPAPSPISVYRAGDRVRVEWHGAVYPADVIAALGGDRYRVHYDGYGSEWDEDIGLNRIQRK